MARVQQPLALVVASDGNPYGGMPGKVAQVMAGGGYAVEVCLRWREARSRLADSRVAVLCGFPGDEAVAALRARARIEAVPPLILVRSGSADPEVLSAIEPWVYAVLADHRIHLDLPRVATKALAEEILKLSRDAAATNPILAEEPSVQTGIILTLSAPQRSIQRVIRQAGFEGSHFHRLWRDVGARITERTGTPFPPPKAFGRIPFFLHGVSCWLEDARVPFTVVAAGLDAHPATFRRLCVELTRMRPADLTVQALPEILMRLESELMGLLRLPPAGRENEPAASET